MSEIIPLSVPSIEGNEWPYIKECLDTSWVSSAGPFVERFEREVCSITGAKHAVACVNGTAALHVALIVAGVRPGDEVLVPTLTFIATINAIHYAGAIPVFMDCDEFYNVDPNKVRDFVTLECNPTSGGLINKVSGRRVSAFVPVHVFGNAARILELRAPLRELGVSMVEDAAESLGTYYSSDAKRLHTGTVGDIGCFSFNGNKIVTAGGGGAIVTNDDTKAVQLRYLTTQAKDDEVRFIHNEIGYNYRLTNIQAALAVAQLENLSSYLSRKLDNYTYYRENIATIPGMKIAAVPEYANNNLWMYALQIDSSIVNRNREDVMKSLGAKGIQTRPVWYLNHLQLPYQKCQAYRIERAQILLDRTLNIPCSVGLTKDQRSRVVAELKAL